MIYCLSWVKSSIIIHIIYIIAATKSKQENIPRGFTVSLTEIPLGQRNPRTETPLDRDPLLVNRITDRCKNINNRKSKILYFLLMLYLCSLSLLLYGVLVDGLYLAFLSLTHSVTASISHTVLNSTYDLKKRYGDLRLNV